MLRFYGVERSSSNLSTVEMYLIDVQKTTNNSVFVALIGFWTIINHSISLSHCDTLSLFTLSQLLSDNGMRGGGTDSFAPKFHAPSDKRWHSDSQHSWITFSLYSLSFLLNA